MDDLFYSFSRWIIPNFVKSNEWLYEDALFDIAEKDALVKMFDRRAEHSERALERQLRDEIAKTKSDVEAERAATNLRYLMGLSKNLKAVRKTRVTYADCRTKLEEFKGLLANFYGQTLQNDVQGVLTTTMSSMGQFVTVTNVDKGLTSAKEVQGRFNDIVRKIENANKSGQLTKEEEDALNNECIGEVKKIAEEMGQIELITSLNRYNNKDGQFTAIADIDSILPKINS